MLDLTLHNQRTKRKATEKEIYFEELFDLDEPDCSSGGVNDILNELEASRPSKPLFSSSQNKRRPSHIPRPLRHLGRTVSAPINGTSPLRATSTEVLHEVQESRTKRAGLSVSIDSINHQARQPSTPDKGSKKSSEPFKMSIAAGRKRKRGKSLDVLPEAQQIFKGLRFYFIPNDDVAPARKLRIRKALERGVTWIKQWDEGITHVIVDKHLTNSDILKFLKIPSIPSSIVVVNETYVSECIQFQMVVNPSQRLYQVQGRQEKPALGRDRHIESSSTTSLPLKPEKGVNNQPSQTPTRTELSEKSSKNQPSDEVNISRSPPQSPLQPPQDSRDRLPDALDRAIEETLAVKDLPLDDEDESPRSSMVIEISDNDDDSEKEAAETEKAPKLPTETSWQEKFSCMSKHENTDKTTNPNTRTVDILQQMASYYDRTQDHWRTLAYRKAISALKKQPRKITTREAALAIPNIGSRLASKIEEIALSNRLRRLENTNLDDRDTALQLFLSIYGVGPTVASQWIDQGHRTLQDLRTKASLTKNQKIGIDHIEDFAARIPRKEVEQHGQIVRDAIQHVDPTIEVTIGGSYRRGAADSGDVDFILTKPDAGIEVLKTVILDTAIPRLFAASYLQASLAGTTSRSSLGSKWHGAACLPGGGGGAKSKRVWRRIDFLFVPYEEMGAALIYFTGNDIFNRSIRLLASKKGFRLNQHGLWRDVIRGRNRERITQGSLVEGRSERRIFEILEVPWRPPSDRIC